MFGSAPREFPLRVGLILIPRFSLIAFTAAVEPMRVANRLSGRTLYEWRLFSIDGAPVQSSCGIALHPEGDLPAAEVCKTIVICGGLDIHRFDDKSLFSWLRRIDRQGAEIGALCTGSHVLARAGLLEGYRSTIHWENLPSFCEDFPEIEVTTELFEIDRNRFTCSGGTAAIDMMLNVITRQHGHELAAKVADQFMHERIRDHHDHQRMSLPVRLGVRHPKLLAVIEIMETNLEEPLSRARMAKDAGLSTCCKPICR
jgi:transcriptional regulator GlxA family with amidase domain